MKAHNRFVVITRKCPIILSILFTMSCNNSLTEYAFEKNVMMEIFPELIDSTCYDSRIYRNPPPLFGKQIFDKSGQYVCVDSTTITEKEKEILNKWEGEIEDIRKDTSTIFFAFDPVISRNGENVKEDFEKHFPSIKLDTVEINIGKKLVLEIDKIKLNNKFKFKNFNEFPKGRDSIWIKKYNFIFSGFVYVTRIQFDKDKSFGVLDAGYNCGGKCGRGYRIFIVKKNNKWKIDKIEGTWIS